MYVIFSLVASRLIPTIACIPALLNTNTTVYSSTALRCMLAPNKSEVQSVLILLVNIVIPWLIIMYCLTRIFVRVYSVSKNSRSYHARRRDTLMNNTMAKRIIEQHSNIHSRGKQQQHQQQQSMTDVLMDFQQVPSVGKLKAASNKFG